MVGSKEGSEQRLPAGSVIAVQSNVFGNVRQVCPSHSVTAPGVRTQREKW